MKVTRLNTRRDVKDAKEDLILEILPRDVQGASLKSPDKCAAALACNRQLGREARIHISRVYIKENGGTTWLRYVTSSHYAPKSLHSTEEDYSCQVHTC